jgi:hypothetical protein
MAIDDIRDREMWTQVASQWCSEAPDYSREAATLYHYWTILARINALQQLFFYYTALPVLQPFYYSNRFNPDIVSPNS